MSGKMDRSVRDWYMEAFPGDDLGPEISGELTFDMARESVQLGDGFYDALGAGDSVVRERVFEELAERMGVDYDEVYRSWIDMVPLEPRGGDTVPSEPSRRIAAVLEGYLDVSSPDRDLYRIADRLLSDPCFDRAVEAIEGMRDEQGKSAVMQDGRFNVFDPVDLCALVAQVSYDTPGADGAAVEDWLDRVNTFSKAAAVEFTEAVGKGEPCELYFLPEADRHQGPQVVTLSELREEFEDSPDLEEDREAGSTFSTWLADGIERYDTVREFTPQFLDGGMSRADIRHDTAREAWTAAFADPVPACGKPITAETEMDGREAQKER